MSEAQDARHLEIATGAIMLTVSALGITLNLLAVLLIYRTPLFRNPFGLICASHLLADVGVLVVFTLWSAPAVLFGFSSSLTHSYFGKRMGQLVMIFWYASMYSQLQIAVNRFIAIACPLLYSSTFTSRRTIHILVAFWILSLLHVVAYFWDGCDFLFDVETATWKYSDTTCGNIISFYLDFVHGTTLCCLVIAIDTFTFFALLKVVKRLSKSIRAKQEVNILKRNVNYYVQGCVQAGCFALMISSFHIFSTLVETKWEIFATTTFIWELMHAVDGIIIFVFNKRLRVLFRHPTLFWKTSIRTKLPSETVIILGDNVGELNESFDDLLLDSDREAADSMLNVD